MNKQRQPRLSKPRFQYAQNQASMALMRMRNPKPPMPLHEIAEQNGWKVVYSELFGPEGYMMKFAVKNETKFGIYIATDLDPFLTKTQQERCQYWTLAHEIGHILLHGQFILNSILNDDEVDQQLIGILEVEAHWFASRLLMPDYVFCDSFDLDPQLLAEKCFVNIQPSQKRIDGLSKARRSLLQEIGQPQFTNQTKKAKRLEKYSLANPYKDYNMDMIDKLRRSYGFD